MTSTVNAAKNYDTKTLAFQRAIEMTPGILSAIDADNRQVDILYERHGRRVTAAYGSDKKAENNDKGEDARNLVYGERALLPQGCRTLQLSTSLVIRPVATSPVMCDNPATYHAATNLVVGLTQSDALPEVARRIAYQMVAGNFLWRNKSVAETVSVEIEYQLENDAPVALRCDFAADLPFVPVMPDLDAPDYPLNQIDLPGFDEFSQAISNALSGDRRFCRITLKAKAGMLPGQEVWPSQVYEPEKEKVGRIPVGRKFQKIDDKPVISADKMGHALRRFDAGHANPLYPLAVIAPEPNGGSLEYGINLRSASNNIYGYLKKLLPCALTVDAASKALGALPADERVYLLGCFVRGGAFVSQSAEKEAEKVSKRAKKSTTTSTENTDSGVIDVEQEG